MKDQLSLKERMAEVLETVDASTKPEELSAKLKPILEELAELDKRGKALGEPTEEEMMKILKNTEEEGAKIGSRLQKAIMKASAHEAVRKVLEEAMRAL
jgi:hypothetical protein